MDLDTLKKELESELLIRNWSPSTAELKEIKKRIKAFNGEHNKRNISKIVSEVVGSYQTIGLEGVDNSDLNTLLFLATKNSSSDDQ